MLDLIHFGGGSQGSGNRKTKVLPSGVRSVNTRVPKDNSPEGKAAKAFYAVLNTLSFDPSQFAIIFSKNNPAIQRRALECLVEIIDVAAYKLDMGFCETEDDIEFGMAAKRAQDAMVVFREAGMLP